jgi:hypothetical protein
MLERKLSLLGLLILASCANPSALLPTPLPAQLGPAETQRSAYQPTDPNGYNQPINLSNVTLTCMPEGDFLVEFDYQPPDFSIDSVQDANSSKTELNCLYPSPGHGNCSGVIDFPEDGVTSLVFCNTRLATERMCATQTIIKSLCIVQIVP